MHAFDVLGDPARRRILELLAQGEQPAGAVTDGRLFVIGGMSGVAAQASATVSIYDPVGRFWSSGMALTEARHHAAAVGLDGAVFVSGGAPSVTDGTPQAGILVVLSNSGGTVDVANLTQVGASNSD